MKFRVTPPWPVFARHSSRANRVSPYFLCSNSFSRNLISSRASCNGGGSSGEGNSFFVPGATVATILMLGILHARRLYDDKKEIPVSMRPYIYKSWARAFHTNLEETALPLEKYASLQEFFAYTLKEGSRTIDSDPFCLVSPVDGTIMRVGELKGSGARIEQVKGFSYSVISLLGENSFLPMVIDEDMAHEERIKRKMDSNNSHKRSWWRVSLASPKLQNPIQSCTPMRGLFYCVIYLKLGDYHRVHSPVDWHVFLRRHFSGRLFPMNERATRTIKNLYIENERVVLEGQWEGGFMAVAAIGATNVGSIKLSIEPDLKTNIPRRSFLQPVPPPDEHVYEPEGIGVSLKKGDEVASFNLGSTVVLVFQAPISRSQGKNGEASDFQFCIKNGDRVRMGEAIGRWHAS
ncbi:phosphatidylserine decarboxylase proenzyme 1, mitochondrial isoform X3 [Aristolochia californica]|uniref:phosphatidylserine decarboxylase proenzyme 1, mitochondrial isoform X3 n=1 Tax=Aristolochia californica TaxID=171875 RepID=UPI0035DB00C8